MKRLNLCMMSAVALILAVAPMARAQDNTTTTTTTTTVDMNDQTVSGTVVSVIGDEVVVTTDSGQRMTFHRDVSYTMPSDIAPGNRVTVTYHGPADDYTMNRIVMVTSAPATTSSSTYSTTTSDSNLPGTASPVPLVGWLGALTLGAGLALRARRA